jgi:hypothetical protein
MTDEELCKALRSALWGQGHHINIKAADRIEGLQQALKDQSSVSDRLAEANEKLTAEREFFEEEWVSAVDKLNKAVEGLRRYAKDQGDWHLPHLCSCSGTYSQNIPTTAYLFPNGNIRPCIEELEAKLAKVVEGLTDLVKDCEAEYPPSHGAIKHFCLAIIAEIENSEAVTLGEKT